MLLAGVFTHFRGHPDARKTRYIFGDSSVEGFGDLLAVLRRLQLVLVGGLERKEISARIEGMLAPISTMNGAFLTPRLRVPLPALAYSDCCTSAANSRDSSIFSLSAIFFTRSCSSWIDFSETAFSRAATSSASGDEVKFR